MFWKFSDANLVVCISALLMVKKAHCDIFTTGSGGGGSALDALLNHLTSQQGDSGTPIHPTPKAPPRRKPKKSSRARDALQRILDRTSGSKPNSLMGRSKERDRSPRPSRDPSSSSNLPGGMPSALYDILQNGNRKRPQKRPPPKIVPKSRSSRRRPPWPPSTAPPRRRQSSRRRGPPPTPSSGRPSPKSRTSRPRPTRPSRPRSQGRSQDSLNQLLKQLGVGNRPSSSGGRRRDGVGGRRGGLADLQRTLSGGGQGGPFGSQQGTSEMAQLLGRIFIIFLVHHHGHFAIGQVSSVTHFIGTLIRRSCLPFCLSVSNSPFFS